MTTAALTAALPAALCRTHHEGAKKTKRTTFLSS